MKDNSAQRSLTKQEQAILDKLLKGPFRGSQELKQQVKACTARSTDDSDNYGSIYLETSSNMD